MFRFGFGLGSKGKADQVNFNSPPPPALDLTALKQAEAIRSQKTLAALERGEVPPSVIERIETQKKGNLPWTSDLSVKEWAALRQYRFEPLGQVMGSSIYHVGFLRTAYSGFFTNSHELAEPTRAMYHSRQLAFRRLAQEAKLLGANAVVGVHLEHKGFHQEERLVEYVAFGTAIRIPGLPPSSEPVLCTVSGQDLARLLMAGTLPVGVALGASYYYLVTDWWDVRQESSWYNQEMQHFQRGVTEVRRLAIRRMREDVTNLSGKGLIGADMHLRVEEIASGRTANENEEIVDHILEIFMLGTVVDYVESGAPKQLSATPVLDLRW